MHNRSNPAVPGSVCMHSVIMVIITFSLSFWLFPVAWLKRAELILAHGAITICSLTLGELFYNFCSQYCLTWSELAYNHVQIIYKEVEPVRVKETYKFQLTNYFKMHNKYLSAAFYFFNSLNLFLHLDVKIIRPTDRHPCN